MSKIFFSADHHFGHVNICKYCGRDYDSTYQMDIDMIERWNSVVAPEDIVYYLGDFSFNPKMFRHRVNGKIHLIQGNHDKNKYLNLFDSSQRYMTLMVGPYRCFLAHQPINVGDEKYWYQDFRNKAMGHDINLTAHIHQRWVVNKNNINLGVDVWNFKPISEIILINFIERVKKENIEFIEKNDFIEEK
jgi:calcineurin-like phosphoesterase family protein